MSHASISCWLHFAACKNLGLSVIPLIIGDLQTTAGDTPAQFNNPCIVLIINSGACIALLCWLLYLDRTQGQCIMSGDIAQRERVLKTRPSLGGGGHGGGDAHEHEHESPTSSSPSPHTLSPHAQPDGAMPKEKHGHVDKQVSLRARSVRLCFLC